MSVKTSFFEVMSEVQKDSEDFSAGIGIFFKIKLLYKFSCNWRSRSARSTLTSPGPIRVKSYIVDIVAVHTAYTVQCSCVYIFFY